MTDIKLILVLITLSTLYSCTTKPPQADNDLQGMWILDKFESFDSLANKWTDDSTRVGWNGYILYDGQGHMGVHLTPKGYKDFDSNKNIDSLNHDDLKELTKFYQSNFVYFANYNVADTTIEHNRLSATEPRHFGTSLTRDLDFKGDTLILTARESIAGLKIRLRWIKL